MIDCLANIFQAPDTVNSREKSVYTFERMISEPLVTPFKFRPRTRGECLPSNLRHPERYCCSNLLLFFMVILLMQVFLNKIVLSFVWFELYINGLILYELSVITSLIIMEFIFEFSILFHFLSVHSDTTTQINF